MEDHHPIKPELGVTIDGNRQSQHMPTLAGTNLIIAVSTLNLPFWNQLGCSVPDQVRYFVCQGLDAKSPSNRLWIDGSKLHAMMAASDREM